jgi:hypothetical protein
MTAVSSSQPFLAPFPGYYFADEVGFFEALGVEFFEVAFHHFVEVRLFFGG